MPARKKSRIGYKRKYSVPSGSRPKKTTLSEVEDVPPDSDSFFSKPLDFFLPENINSSDPVDCESRTVECEDSDGFWANEFIVILDKPYVYSPAVPLEEFVESSKCRIFCQLREDCKNNLSSENFIFVTKSCDIKYVEIYDWDSPRVKTCVCVNKDFTLHVTVHGKSLPDTHHIYEKLGRQCYSVECVRKVLDFVSQFDICTGNQDSDLQDLIPVGAFLDIAQGYKYQGYRESYNESTIRSTKCEFLVRKTGRRCVNCQTYRRTLRKTLSRKERTPKIPTPQKDWTKCKTSNKNLTENQKLHKIKQLKEYSLQLELENEKLRSEIKRKIRTEGVTLTESESKDITELMEKCEDEIKRSHPDESSYQRLFWEQQLKCSKGKDSRGMRWHPSIIKWCIYLKSKSSSTYDTLRNSGFIKLPSERTLFDYTNANAKGVGFLEGNIDMLIDETQGYTDHQKIVGLLQDEVKIKSDLVYDRHSGELIGFVNLGSINNNLNQLQQDTEQLAKYVLVVMVRGISSNLKFPLAHFATKGVTSDQLFCILWEAVEICEIDVGLKVLFITSDGASPNRRFIRLHGRNGLSVFKSNNVFSSEPRDIYFISDVPHLIKTTRNCFSNSYSHRNSRKMWKDNCDISWMHIVNLYNDHCCGLYRLCPKLTQEHVNLTSFNAMKVKLATQVLSSTVAHALELNYDARVTETVKFIRHMNKFFDCLNTRNLGEAARSRNENMKVYREVNDNRLNYLKNDFLGFFTEWKQSVENRRGNFTKSQRNGMMLSYQTLDGFYITVNSVINCVQYCLRQGMDFVCTEKFNQDPIEQHFGIHRASLGSNTNPRLYDLNNAMVKIRTAGSQAIAPFRGNTRRRLELAPLDDTPLNKRKR